MVIIRSFFVLDIYPKNGGPGGSRTRVRNSLSLSHSQAWLINSLTSKVSRKNPTILIESQDLTCYKQGNHFDLVYFGGINHLS